MTIWLDGQWIEGEAARLATDDRGLLLGDGLFETLRVRGGEPVRLEAHIVRLNASCAELGLAMPFGDGEAGELIAGLVSRAGLQDAAIRLSLTAGRGPRGLERSPESAMSCLISAAPLATPPAAVTLATSALRRSASSIAARHKTLSYIDNVIARRQARLAGAGMALLLDTDGHLSGGDCANLFWTRGDRLFTPALDCAVLPGTARAALIAALDVEQGACPTAELAAADGIFITNALMGAVAVTQLDGQPLGRGAPIPAAVTDALS